MTKDNPNEPALHMVRSLRQGGGIYSQCGHIITDPNDWVGVWETFAKSHRKCKNCVRSMPNEELMADEKCT